MENIQNMQEEKSRKKLLVPLVVLLLCAVSLTGAAYAYNSSVTSIDNNVHVEGLSISLKDGDTSVTGALYDLKVAYSGHTQTGKSAPTELKAIRYSLTDAKSVGFKTGNTVTYDDDVTAEEMKDLTAYATGSYVDTQYAVGNGAFTNAVGYRTFDFGANGPTKEQLDAGINNGIYKIGKEYTIDATNHSGKSVTLTLNVKYSEDDPDFGKGVVGIYLVISGTIPEVEAEGGSEAVNVSKVVRLDTGEQLISENLFTMGKDQGTNGTDIKMQAYLVCSDFYSATAFGAEESDIGFVVNVTAKTA